MLHIGFVSQKSKVTKRTARAILEDTVTRFASHMSRLQLSVTL